MGRKVDKPCHHVISFRVNEQERRILDQWTSETGMNVSTMMREVIHNIDTVIYELSRTQQEGVEVDMAES